MSSRLGGQYPYSGYYLYKLHKVSENSVQKMRSSMFRSITRKDKEVSIAYQGLLHRKKANRLSFGIHKSMNVSQEFCGENNSIIHCYTDKIKGNDIFLRFPSVGATQNVITAVLGEGITRILMQLEAKVLDLCNILGWCKIRSKTAFIEIEGVKALHDVE